MDKYRHQSAVLEQKLLDTEIRLQSSEDSVRSADEIQDRLNKRYMYVRKTSICCLTYLYSLGLKSLYNYMQCL